MAAAIPMEEVDLLVIGAGISGMAMARAYLEVHPHSHLVLLERDHSVGGAWSKPRSYDHFWTQWAWKYAQFSDLAMPEPPPEDQYHGFFRAIHTTNYLERYADHHDFAGKSIRDRVRFGTEVKSIEKVDDRWHVTSTTDGGATNSRLSAARLAIASGLTSVPNRPILNGSSDFGAPIVHMLEFGRSDVLNPQIQNVTVIGGAKSAADMVYTAVKAGKNVSWVVKPGGLGPAFFAPAQGGGPFESAFDIGSTRSTQYLNPSIFSSGNSLLKLLHETQRGANLVGKVWAGVEKSVNEGPRYKDRPCKKGFDKLAPHTGLLWSNGPGGLINRSDFLDVIARHVDIYCEHITHLEHKKICLQGGTTLDADALLCGTGWVDSVGFISEQLRAELGLPYHAEACPEAAAQWAQLDKAAEDAVVKQFPLLAQPPPHFLRKSDSEPFRLYNTIAPLPELGNHLHDQSPATNGSVVIIGQLVTANYFRTTECQALWATAYLDGHLKLPSNADCARDMARNVAYSKRRYLSRGQQGNNLVFDTLSYGDKLLADLGLTSHRQRNMMRHLFWPTTTAETKGLMGEYIAKYGRDGDEDGSAMRGKDGVRVTVEQKADSVSI